VKSEELLKNGFKELQVSCSEAQIKSFLTLLSELKKWNRAYNLTGLKTDRDIIIKHFLDSLLYIRAIPAEVQKLADVGSGAGFPGLPLKIMMPEMEMSLIESSRKKTAFLRHITRMLKLEGVEILEKRIEDLDSKYKKSFDVVVSRATFSIVEFIELACPYVNDRGMLILNKGPKLEEELKDLQKSSSKKASCREIMHLELPIIMDKRNLVVLECKPH
jgi:16S rRNA (guanine527-N7)-methyltransferase